MRKRARRRVAPPSSLLRTSAGYVVTTQRQPGEDALTVSSPGGQVCLRVRLLPEGPVLEVLGQSLRFVSEGDLRFECERLAIEARREVSVRAGALHQSVSGDVRLHAGGVIEQEAHAQRLRARLGDIQLSANDDVEVDGERIRLNSPKDLPPFMASLLGAAK